MSAADSSATDVDQFARRNSGSEPESRARRDEPAIQRRSLPMYKAGGQYVSTFVALQQKEAPIAVEVAALDLGALQRQPLLSANAKTSFSLDFPLGQTCQPTPLCSRVCYAASPGAATTWSKSLRKRLSNLRYFQLEDPAKAIARLTSEVDRKGRRWEKEMRRRHRDGELAFDYLRVNGTGDLFPELIPVLNGFAAGNPHLKVWIVTRRFDLAALIDPLPNIFLQLSLDATTPPKRERAARRVVETHPRAYLSFLRVSATDDTRGAAIVFNEKHTPGLPYSDATDCPVDAGRRSLENVRGVGGTACADCRKCFKDEVLERQCASPTGSGNAAGAELTGRRQAVAL